MLGEILEASMIILFGISWPISVYKSFKAKIAKGKSILFLSFILVGYIVGILGKIITNNINWVFIFYCINLTFVSIDFILYFYNHKRDKELNKTAQ